MKSFDEIAALLGNEEKIYILDSFPFTVLSSDKIFQVEFRQKPRTLRQKKRADEMKNSVCRFLEFMWLYSDTNVYVYDSVKSENKHIRNRFGIVLNSFSSVSDVSEIEYLVKKNCKGKLAVYFVFENFLERGAVYFYLDATTGVLYFENKEALNDIEKLASSCNMFLRKKQ